MRGINGRLSLAIILLFALLSLLSMPAVAQSQDEKDILALMRLEEEYWNKGDIEAYVSLYAPHDSVRMIYSNGAVYGKDSILAFFKKYWPKERMGQLTLDGERLERISSEYYFVSGFFHVRYPEARAINGRFSGLMKKIKGRWYIYTDHSG